MTKRLRSLLLLVGLGMLVVLVTVFRPQAEEVEDSDATPSVSESELQLYIKVYGAMQDNHDLTIDNAIAPYQISLDDFRALERRIQSEPRMVERVRQALLQQAQAHSVFAQSMATPSPVATAAETPKKKHKKKK